MRIIIIIVMQVRNTLAAACVEHVSVQATGQDVYTNISIAAVVHFISSCASRGTQVTYKFLHFHSSSISVAVNNSAEIFGFTINDETQNLRLLMYY